MKRLLRKLAGEKAGPDKGSDEAASDGGLQLHGLEASVRVETDFGPVPVMLLRPRDRLRTVGGGFVELKSIKTTAFDPDVLISFPDASAITISEGVFGSGLPRQDISVAPHQTITGDPLRKGREAVTAEDCLSHPGVARAAPEETVYHVLRCEASAQILAEGLAIRV